jgi:hypothetical protein
MILLGDVKIVLAAIDDDAGAFSTTSLPKVDDESLLDESESRPTDDRPSICPPAPAAFHVPAEIAVQNSR